VNRALATLRGVQAESVQIGRASIRFDETVISPTEIAEAVSKAGYRATPVMTE
jgi:copper chaperone CopZ